MSTKVTTVTTWSIRLTRNTEESLPPFVIRPMITTKRDTTAVTNSTTPCTERHSLKRLQDDLTKNALFATNSPVIRYR